MKSKYLTHKNIDSFSEKLLSDLSGQRIAFFKKNFDINSSALVVVDAQLYFTSNLSHAWLPSSEPVISRIKEIVSFFNKRKLLVVFTKHIDIVKPNNMLLRWWREKINSLDKLSELDDRIYDGKSDIIIKHTYDAFYSTRLYSYLKKNKIKKVFVSGFVTNLCCETTARSAFVRDFEVWFGIDTTAAYSKEHHISSITNLSHGFAVPFILRELYEL